MNRLKNLTIKNSGMFLIIAVVAALFTVTADGQVSDVNVVNTPTVLFPRGATIGIDSSNNTVKLDETSPVTVRGEKTEVILNQLVTASCCPPTVSAKVDVSAYKQIRIVVKSETGNNSGVWITPLLRLDNTQDYYGDRIPLDASQQNSLNKVYDTPGQFVQVQLQGSGSIRVVIFGRRN